MQNSRQALQHSHTLINLHLQVAGLYIGGDKSRLFVNHKEMGFVADIITRCELLC